MQRLLVIAYPWDPAAAALSPVYLANDRYASKPSDTPANTTFRARLTEGYDFEARLWSGDEPGGAIEAGDLGRVRIANGDGAFDAALSYGWDGRKVEFYTVEAGAAFSTATLRAKATIERIEWDEGGIDVILRSARARFERDLERVYFSGAGELAGAEELRLRPKPLLAGGVTNIPAPIVDAVNLIYQVHDGFPDGLNTSLGISQVRDMGVTLTDAGNVDAEDLVDAKVYGGQYKTATTPGLFKLGAVPNGIVTVDSFGPRPSAALSKVGEIVEYLAKERLGPDSFQTGEIDGSSFSDLNSAQPAQVGKWIGIEAVRADALVAEIMGTIGGVAYADRLEKLKVWRLVDPDGETATATIDEGRISKERPLKQISRTAPAWLYSVEYARLARAQAETEFADSVNEGQRLIYKTPFKLRTARGVVVDATLAPASTVDAAALAFKSDGTKVYAATLASGTVTVRQYALSTAWDLATAGSVEASKTFTAAVLGDISFNVAGTKFYLTGGSSTDAVKQYPLSTAWDISTAGAKEAEYGLSLTTFLGGPAFNGDGTKVFYVTYSIELIVQLRRCGLSTAYEIDTAGAVEQNLEISTLGTALGLHRKPDGARFYSVDADTYSIIEIPLGTADDLTSALPIESGLPVVGDAFEAQDVRLSSDGARLYIGGLLAADAEIRQIDLETAYVADSVKTTRAAHAGARSVTRRGLLRNSADARAEAVRQLALHGVPPELYELGVTDAVFEFDLGQIVTLTHSRFGLDAGKNFVVRGIAENWRRNETTLELWRPRKS